MMDRLRLRWRLRIIDLVRWLVPFASDQEPLRVIRFALTIDDHFEMREFLDGWMHGDTSEWPEFADGATNAEGEPWPERVS